MKSIKINASVAGEYRNIHFFDGEDLRFAISGRTDPAEIVVTIATDHSAAPFIEAVGGDEVILTAAVLADMPEGERCAYNVWTRTAATLVLLCRGYITAQDTIQPGEEEPVPLAISGQPGGTGQVGESYSFQPAVIGGAAPYMFASTGTGLPAGLALDPDTGLLSGTPVTHGSYTGFVITVTDAEGASAALPAFSLTITPATLSITGTPSLNVAEGAPYLFEPQITGGVPPYFFDLATGTLPAGIVLDSATGILSGAATEWGSFADIAIRVTDDTGTTALLPAFDLTVTELIVPEGIAFVWRWGQSNEGTLGNNPGQTDAQYRGAFPTIRQADNDGNTLGPDETYALVPYAILNDGDADVVIGGDTISAPQGEYTVIGDGIPVGPSFGIAVDIRDNGLFAHAEETWFWKASSAGKPIRYFMPPGEIAAYHSGESDTIRGWQYKCYANRQLRAELAAETRPVYIQCTGQWQGEADTNPARTAEDTGSAYIVNYGAEHQKVYQSDVDVLGVEPPYFVVQLAPVWNDTLSARDPYTDALNAARKAMCRYTVDISGAITDNGSGHAKMYFVEHDLGGKIAAQSPDPHVTSDEQRRIGQAISAALRTLHGSDGFTTAYPLTEVKPQLVGIGSSLNGTVLTVTGYYSDPGVITVTARQVSDDSVVATGSATITDTYAGATPFSIDIPLPGDTEIAWSAALELASGEISVPKGGSLITPSLVRSYDATFGTEDFTYSTVTSLNDTALRSSATGSRYARGTPPSNGGKRYFEIALTGDCAFLGLGLPDTPQAGGTNGIDRSGILGTNIQYSGGSVSVGSGIVTDCTAQVAFDADAGLMWIRADYMTDWNVDPAADPASGTGGLDISGMDLTRIVPLVGFSASHTGALATLVLEPGNWTLSPPAGYGAIG
ncbi:Ig domain-containing protein [Pseudooceanicola sp. C21-150M6]